MKRFEALLRCPHDGAVLAADPPATTCSLAGYTGALVCASCAKRFPVDDGIARFVDDETLEHEDMAKEMVARDASAAKYEDRWDRLRNEIEVIPCLRAMDATAEDVVVELGCGTGRVTRQYLADVAFVVAVDFSTQSLRLLRDALVPHEREKLLLVQADICRPPLAPAAFRKVVSFQVIEHMPTEALRERAVDAAATLMSEGGALVATVYHWSSWKRYFAKRGKGDNTQKTGYHATSPPIYFVNFVEDEARALFSRGRLRITDVAGVCIQLPLLPFFRWLALPVHRLLARTRFGKRNSHLLLVRAVHEDARTTFNDTPPS